jgi:hypothetical protein
VRRAALVAGLVFVAAAFAFGDLHGVFSTDINHPAIEYSTRPVTDPVSRLNLEIRQGKVHLAFDDKQGYLHSVLQALNVPVESQMLVFSKTSIQLLRISPQNPRSLFFNDSVAVGWVRGGPFMEFAAEDPAQGVIFYTLDQKPAAPPQFLRREGACLSCHESYSSLGVPGMLVHSVFPSRDGIPLREAEDYATDDRTPFEQRWGGWYVTGITGSMRHMGNAVVINPADSEPVLGDQTLNLESLHGKFDTDAYLSPFSDIVALMVFEHQMHVMNLFTRVGWEVRFALYEDQTSEAPENRLGVTDALLRETAREVVDYMLFVDEKPLTAEIRGTSGFSQAFSAQGPIDSEGRSLRQLDLKRRLMRYPCSYMIYSPAFDGLPDEARDAIYARLWLVLSGRERAAKYARLSLADRQAVVEILRETKKGLPAYFQPPTD